MTISLNNDDAISKILTRDATHAERIRSAQSVIMGLFSSRDRRTDYEPTFQSNTLTYTYIRVDRVNRTETHRCRIVDKTFPILRERNQSILDR